MRSKLTDVFDRIHAEEELKDKTKKYLQQTTHQYQKSKKRVQLWLIPAVISLFFIIIGFGGYQFYFTPTSIISIDVNPSLELGINRFDQVVSVEALNQDGQALKDSLNIQFESYQDAVKQILENEDIQSILSQNEEMSIVVVGSDTEKNTQMLTELETFTSGQNNVSCYQANQTEVENAHSLGLSYGKYKAFLVLQELDSSITPEQVQQMSMREIRNLISSLSNNTADAQLADGQNGKGNRHGQKWKNAEE